MCEQHHSARNSTKARFYGSHLPNRPKLNRRNVKGQHCTREPFRRDFVGSRIKQTYDTVPLPYPSLTPPCSQCYLDDDDERWACIAFFKMPAWTSKKEASTCRKTSEKPHCHERHERRGICASIPRRTFTYKSQAAPWSLV